MHYSYIALCVLPLLGTANAAIFPRGGYEHPPAPEHKPEHYVETTTVYVKHPVTVHEPTTVYKHKDPVTTTVHVPTTVYKHKDPVTTTVYKHKDPVTTTVYKHKDPVTTTVYKHKDPVTTTVHVPTTVYKHKDPVTTTVYKHKDPVTTTVYHDKPTTVYKHKDPVTTTVYKTETKTAYVVPTAFGVFHEKELKDLGLPIPTPGPEACKKAPETPKETPKKGH